MDNGARRRVPTERAPKAAEVPPTPGADGYLGKVGITKSATIQVVQFHPVVAGVSLELPVEPGETPREAIRRVHAIVDEELKRAVGQVVEEGAFWK
jgi:hypothetical protein